VVVGFYFSGTNYEPLYIENAIQTDKVTKNMLEAYFNTILENKMPNYKNYEPNVAAEELFEKGLRDVLIRDTAHFESGANLLKIAAGEGSVRAMDLLGYLYENAYVGGRYNPDNSAEWFLKTSDFGSLAGLAYICKYYAFKKDYKTAAPYCQKSADDGVPMSMAIMAEFYFGGLGVKKNPSAGKSLICEAMNKGRKAGNILSEYGISCDTVAYDE
jgi:TPR repeat protein